MKPTPLLLVVAALALTIGSPANGQPAAAATLIGTIRDGSGAIVQGATVLVSASQGVPVRNESRTDQKGEYIVRGLRPGIYTLEAEAPGFSAVKRSEIILVAGQTGVVDLLLTPGPIDQEIAVTGTAPPVLDVGSAAHVTRIDEQLLQTLPAHRSVAGLVNLAPGIHDNVALGSTERAIAMTLDGTPGSESGWGAPFLNPNINWLDEVVISTTGAGVAAPDSTGARLAGRLRSGGARFSGLAEYWRSPNWIDDNGGALPDALRSRFRPLEIVEHWGGNGQVGGPAVPDRLWFFSGTERLRHDMRTSAFNDVARAPDEPFTSNTESRAVLKLTAALHRTFRPEAFYSYDSGTARGLNAALNVRPEAYLSARTIERAWGAGFTASLSGTSLLQVQYGGHAVVTTNEPTPPGEQSGPLPHTDRVTGTRSGNAPFFNRMTSKPQMISGALSHAVTAFGRPHQLQAGGEWGTEGLTTENGYPGGGYYTDLNGVPVMLDLWAGARYAPRQNHTALYVQDTWRPASRVTAVTGVRFTSSRGSVPVRGTVISATSVTPRVGLTFDVTGAHDTIVRAYWGRQHEPLFTSDYDYLDPSRDSPWRTYTIDGNGGLTLVDESIPSSRVGIQEDIRLPHVDEFSTSVERLLPYAVTVRVEYVRRAYRDFIVTSDVGSTYTPISRIDPGADGRLNTADDGPAFTAFNNVNPQAQFLLLTNTPDAFRDYRAVRIVLTRSSSHGLAFQGSYMWSADRGSISNAAGNRAGNFDGGSAGAFVDPNRAMNRIGSMPFDAPHEAKLFAAWSVARLHGLTVGGVARVQSGRPWERQVPITGLRQGFVLVRVEPRGSRRTTPVSGVDLRLDMPFAQRNSAHAGIYVDVYNLLNTGYAIGVQPVAGASMGTPSAWSAPRAASIGVRTTF